MLIKLAIEVLIKWQIDKIIADVMWLKELKAITVSCRFAQIGKHAEHANLISLTLAA